jgi:hypothetical protein
MTSLTDPDVVFAEHPELGIVAAASTPGGPDRGDHALTARGWIHHEKLDIYTLPGRLDRASALTVVSGTIRALQNKGQTVAADPGLAQAVFRRRAEARNAAPLVSRRGPDAAVAAVQTAPPPPPQSHARLILVTTGRRSTLPEARESFMTIRHALTGETTTTSYNAAARKILLESGFVETPDCACEATKPGTERTHGPARQPANCSSRNSPCTWTEPSVSR